LLMFSGNAHAARLIRRNVSKASLGKTKYDEKQFNFLN
jgi:hypothetical protein